MFLKIATKCSKILKPKKLRELKDGEVIQFEPWIPRQWYCVVIESGPSRLKAVFRYNVALHNPTQSWWEDEEGSTYCGEFTPYQLNRNPMSDELVFIPTGEVFKSTKLCDWRHIICLDEGGNRWLINCNLLTTKENYARNQRIPDSGDEIRAEGEAGVSATTEGEAQ